MGKAITHQVLKALFRLIHARGQGIQRLLKKAIGLGSDQVFTRLKHSDDMPLSRFVDLTYALGISPASFLKVPGEHVQTAALPIPRKKERALTAIEIEVEAALDRGEGTLTQDELAGHLEAIDDLRYASPLNALEHLKALCADTLPQQTPYVLAVAASCLRMLAQDSYASRCLIRGRNLAERFGDRLALGELYQRSVYFFDSMGYPPLALECAERATLIFTRIGQRRKTGESLVDQGFCFYQLKRYEDCLLVNHDAGRFHEEFYLRTRVTRFQISGNALRQLGRIEEALTFIQRATAEGIKGMPYLQAKVFWAEGLARGLKGTDNIEKAIALLIDSLPIDAALASVDLCRIYLSSERFEEAYQVARQMKSFIEPFDHVPDVTQALRELILIGTAASGLHMELLEKTAKTIRENRTRYYLARPVPHTV